jgi:hypothetical protein
MFMTNKELFAKTYAAVFVECYPELPAAESQKRIEMVAKVACENIRRVLLDGKAFKLTSKRLGIKHTYKAYEEFLNAAPSIDWNDFDANHANVI